VLLAYCRNTEYPKGGGGEEQGEREEGRGKEKKTDDKNKYNQQLL
jgi:hypothetical protein